MANWQQKVYEKLIPLFNLLKKTVKSGPVIQMDETTVQVMGEEGRSDTQKSYMWLARGGPPDKKAILFNYRETRAAKHATEFLEGYSGYLQTDDYAGYNCAVKDNPNIIHVGCFAHARRYFFEASKATKTPQSAQEGIKHISKLYEVENKLRQEKKEREETENKMSEEEFLKRRKTDAAPILEKFKSWLLKRKGEVNPTSLLGKAINYTLNDWTKLIAYLESPYLTPDNNACENAIRPFVLGRKNWLFSKSPKGAESACGGKLVVLIEQQSTVNPNITLRLLMYIARVYEKITEDKDRYAKKPISIPRPEFFVLYNGKDPFEDEAVLKLSDSFEKLTSLGLTEKETPALELEVKIININDGKNDGLVNRCKTLAHYRAFISKAREFEKEGLSKKEAVKKAIYYCRDHDIMKEYLEEHASEVLNMLMGEWNWDDAKEVWQEEAREEGREEKQIEIARNMLMRARSLQEIAEDTGLSLEIVERLKICSNEQLTMTR